MAEVDPREFDPYYKWLAIPPQEQPPNSYRLLGVTLFEDDPEVIAAAADRQMAHIKSFAAGKHASHSQRLLNELSKARVCLLNAEQKARYDVRLRDEINAEVLDESLDSFFAKELEDAPTPTCLATITRSAAPASVPAAPPPIAIRARPQRRNQRSWIPLVLLPGLICVLFAAIHLFGTEGRPQKSSASDTPVKPELRPDVPKEIDPPPQEIRRPVPPQPNARPAPNPIPGFPDAPKPQPPPMPQRNEIRRRNVPLAQPPVPNQADVTIDVDLTKPRQRVEVNHDSFQILRLRIADEVTNVSQPLSKAKSAVIEIDAPAKVFLQLEIEDRMNGTFVLVTPRITVSGKDISFTLKNLSSMNARLMKEYKAVAKNIAALESELQELTIFIESPMIKALADRGRAQTRKMQIEKLLPPLKQQLARMETTLQEMARLIELAKVVNADCVVELAEAN